MSPPLLLESSLETEVERGVAASSNPNPTAKATQSRKLPPVKPTTSITNNHSSSQPRSLNPRFAPLSDFKKQARDLRDGKAASTPDYSKSKFTLNSIQSSYPTKKTNSLFPPQASSQSQIVDLDNGTPISEDDSSSSSSEDDDDSNNGSKNHTQSHGAGQGRGLGGTGAGAGTDKGRDGTPAGKSSYGGVLNRVWRPWGGSSQSK